MTVDNEAFGALIDEVALNGSPSDIASMLLLIEIAKNVLKTAMNRHDAERAERRNAEQRHVDEDYRNRRRAGK